MPFTQAQTKAKTVGVSDFSGSVKRIPSDWRARLSLRDRSRKAKSHAMTVLLVLCAAAAIVPLASVFYYVLSRGVSGVNWAFFTQLPAGVGEEGGGMANALAGTITLVAMASLAGIPVGMLAGIYLSEYGRGRFAETFRFMIDVLASVPSILVGLFAYAVLVKPFRHFSAHAGAFALAVIMVPIVARSTEEILKLVPVHIREAGLALGIPRWKVILRVVVQGNLGGLSTGIMLAVARAAGETAPLLFTAFSNQYWNRGLDQPIASLPVQIYTYAISPFDEWHRQAWAGALVLVSFVLALNAVTRFILRRQAGGRE